MIHFTLCKSSNDNNLGLNVRQHYMLAGCAYIRPVYISQEYCVMYPLFDHVN